MGRWKGPLGTVDAIQWQGNRQVLETWLNSHGLADKAQWPKEDPANLDNMNVLEVERAERPENAGELTDEQKALREGPARHADFLVVATDSETDPPTTKLLLIAKDDFLAHYTPLQPSGGL